jgi:hypothetical protein
MIIIIIGFFSDILIVFDDQIVEDIHHVVVLVFDLFLIRCVEVLIDVAEFEGLDFVGAPDVELLPLDFILLVGVEDVDLLDLVVVLLAFYY